MIAIFDFFGVVVDWRSEYVMPEWTKYASVSESVFKKEWDVQLALCETGQISQSELFERLGRKFNVDPAGLESILRTKFQSRAKLNDGVVRIIESLPNVVLLSNQLPLHAEISKKNGWFSYFTKVFLSYELGYRKPEAKAYSSVLDELGVKPSEAVLIDDKQENLESAKKLGMHVILYQDAGQLQKMLDKIYKANVSK